MRRAEGTESLPPRTDNREFSGGYVDNSAWGTFTRMEPEGESLEPPLQISDSARDALRSYASSVYQDMAASVFQPEYSMDYERRGGDDRHIVNRYRLADSPSTRIEFSDGSSETILEEYSRRQGSTDVMAESVDAFTWLCNKYRESGPPIYTSPDYLLMEFFTLYGLEDKTLKERETHVKKTNNDADYFNSLCLRIMEVIEKVNE